MKIFEYEILKYLLRAEIKNQFERGGFLFVYQHNKLYRTYVIRIYLEFDWKKIFFSFSKVMIYDVI